MLPYTQARNGLVAFSVLILSLVTVGAAYLAGSAARPLRQLTEAVRSVSSGSYDRAVDISSGDEFGELATSFDAMRTAIAEREEQISYQALYDSVTGLPNRSHVTRMLDDQIARSDSPTSVLYIRLLRMNAIASTLGYNGDIPALLTRTSQRPNSS